MSNTANTVLYIGVTNDLARRVREHKSGAIPGFTQKYNCHKLVYYEEFSEVDQALEREQQLKKWSRVKKDSLIDTMNKDREDLYEISPLAAPSATLRAKGSGRNDTLVL